MPIAPNIKQRDIEKRTDEIQLEFHSFSLALLKENNTIEYTEALAVFLFNKLAELQIYFSHLKEENENLRTTNS